MNPIRPSVLPPNPPLQPEPGKLAAQRAFFAAATGAAQDAAAPQAAPAAPAPRASAPAADAPHKILRPGSLIDIRV